MHQGDLLAALDVLESAGMLPPDPPPAAATRKAPTGRTVDVATPRDPAADDADAIRRRWADNIAAARAKFDHADGGVR